MLPSGWSEGQRPPGSILVSRMLYILFDATAFSMFDIEIRAHMIIKLHTRTTIVIDWAPNGS